nr:unnamed protein product [Spirometra erinaceieuropaei]
MCKGADTPDDGKITTESHVSMEDNQSEPSTSFSHSAYTIGPSVGSEETSSWQDGKRKRHNGSIEPQTTPVDLLRPSADKAAGNRTNEPLDRQHCVVVQGLSESDAPTTKVRISADLNMLQHLLNKMLKSSEKITIRAAFRIGKKVSQADVDLMQTRRIRIIGQQTPSPILYALKTTQIQIKIQLIVPKIFTGCGVQVSQEDIINVIDTLRAELVAARKKSESLELEKKKRIWEKENEILELESSLKSLINATKSKERPPEFPEKFCCRNDRKQDYLAELEGHLAEVDRKAEDRTSTIVQKLQALEQALQKSEKNEVPTQREHDPPQKARPDQSPRAEALQEDRARKQYEEFYGAAVEALELGKHILKDVDEMAFNSLFTTGHRGVHALPSIIFCLYSAIRTLRSNLASKTAKYQQSAEVIKNIKEEILSDKSKMASDFDKRFKEEKSKMHSELAAAIQRAEVATQEARTISERANKARESLQQELVEKNKTITELRKVSADENAKLNANIATLEAKIHALETSVEESRRETTRVKTERDEAKKHYSSLTAKLEAREEHVHKLENDLMDKTDKWHSAERRLQEATDALNHLYEVTTQATKTTTEINCLLEKFGHKASKQPCVEETIPKKPPSPLEIVKKLCAESSRLATEHRNLMAQKTTLATEMEKQIKMMKDSQSTISKLRSHICVLERERTGIANSLELKTTQLQRISKERDYFLQLLNKKTEEVAALKATRTKTPEPMLRVSSPAKFSKTLVEPKIILTSEPQLAIKTTHIKDDPKTDSLKVSLENEGRDIGKTIENTTKEILCLQRKLCYEVPRPRPSANGGDEALEELMKRADENPKCLSPTADSVTDKRLESLRTHLDTLKKQTSKITNRHQNIRHDGSKYPTNLVGRRSLKTSKGFVTNEAGKTVNPAPKKREHPSLRSRAQKLLKSQQYNCSADRYFCRLGPESSDICRAEDADGCCCCPCASARIDKHRRPVDEKKSAWTRSRSYGPFPAQPVREETRQEHGDGQHNVAGEANYAQADITITPAGRSKENETMLLANKLRQSMKKLQKSAENLLVRVRSSSRDPPLPPPPPQKCVRDVGQSHHHHRHRQVVTRHSTRDPTAKRRHRSLSVNSPQERLGVPTAPDAEEGQFDQKYRERSEEPMGNRSALLMEDPHEHLFPRRDSGDTVYNELGKTGIRPQLDGHSDASNAQSDVIEAELDASTASCCRPTTAESPFIGSVRIRHVPNS